MAKDETCPYHDKECDNCGDCFYDTDYEREE